MENTPEKTESTMNENEVSIESKLKQLNENVGDDLRKQAVMLEKLGSDDVPEDDECKPDVGDRCHATTF